MTGAKHAGTATYDGTRNHANLAVGQMTAMSREVNRMDRYDPYTDKFLRDTQYGILDTDVPDTNVGDMISRRAAIDICNHAVEAFTGQFGAGVLTVIRDDIAELPSAQPEIIHCKDCKYRNPFIKDTATMWLPCMAIDTDDKWFCGYGE